MENPTTFQIQYRDHQRQMARVNTEGWQFDPPKTRKQARETVALSRAKRKVIVVASQSVFSLFSADEETFAHAQLWKNLLRRTCTTLLWTGGRNGHRVRVWGNATDCVGASNGNNTSEVSTPV